MAVRTPSRRFPASFIGLALVLCVVAPEALGGEIVATRCEVASSKGMPIRILQIMDVTNAELRGDTRGVQLWEVGEGLRFVHIYSVSNADRRSSYSLIGPTGSQVVSVKRGLDLMELSRADLDNGLRVFKAGGTEFVVRREDAASPTVRARVDKALREVLSAAELEALRKALRVASSCDLMMARGYLLPVLAPDVYKRDSAPCDAGFRDVPQDARDPRWDLGFVAMEPAVREFLGWKAEIHPGVYR
jgi:hypothetical protein